MVMCMVQQSSCGNSLGQVLHALREEACGTVVQVLWPKDETWWTAKIKEYNFDKDTFTLVYDEGTIKVGCRAILL